MHSFYLKGMFSIDAGFYISVYICSVIIYYAFGSVLLHNQPASERREKWQIGQKGTFQKVLGYGSERHSNLFGPPRSFASHAQKSGHRKLGAFRYYVRQKEGRNINACQVSWLWTALSAGRARRKINSPAGCRWLWKPGEAASWVCNPDCSFLNLKEGCVVLFECGFII